MSVPTRNTPRTGRREPRFVKIRVYGPTVTVEDPSSPRSQRDCNSRGTRLDYAHPEFPRGETSGGQFKFTPSLLRATVTARLDA
jgi:hypothetical protein